MDNNEFHKAIIAVWDFISILNKYIDKKEPWTIAKDESRQNELACVIYNLIESIRVVGCLIFPIMPQTSNKMQTILNINDDEGFKTIEQIIPWNQIIAGTKIDKAPMLFPRVDPEKLQQKVKVQKNKSDKQSVKLMTDLQPEITIDDFLKVDLRTGTIIKAQKIEKSNKLLKLEVDLGEEKSRQIIAGIAKSYKPDDIVGKQVVVVANLKPAKLMGHILFWL